MDAVRFSYARVVNDAVVSSMRTAFTASWRAGVVLGLRFRSQERLSKGVRSFLEAMGEHPDRLGFRR